MGHDERFRGTAAGGRRRRSAKRERRPRRSSTDAARQRPLTPEQVSRTVWRSASFGYAAVVAVVSLLPSGPMSRVRLFADQAVDFHVVFSYVSALVLGACLVVSASRARTILRFSWPLFGVATSYAVIMGLLVLSALGYELDGAPARIDEISASLSVHHAVIYAAFAVVAAIGWRDRIALPVLGLILVAFGAVLELWQTSVPGRTSGMADAVSNGIGVAVGLAGVGVMDALQGRRSPHATTSRRRWRRT